MLRMTPGGLALPFFGGGPEPSNPSSPPIEQLKPKERENRPLEKDALFDGTNYHVLSGGKRYELTAQEFEEHKKVTKFEEYDRRVFTISKEDILQIEKGEIPPSELVSIKYSGHQIVRYRTGQEINVYFSGFLDDHGVPYSRLSASRNTFLAIRKKLDHNGFDSFFHSAFFTYGVEVDKVVNEYDEMTAKDTAKNPNLSIEQAFEFFSYLKEKFPLAQINLIGFSLGAHIALQVARKFPGDINNLISIEGPLNGMELTLSCRIELPFVQKGLEATGIKEEVTPYLTECWNNE